MVTPVNTLRIATRGSALALAQSRRVQAALESHHDIHIELEVLRTTGDRHPDRALPEIGGKGLFTLQLDRALLAGDVDLAVHSLKDLPTELEEGLVLGCVPDREDPRDVLVSRPDSPVMLETLPPGSVVGTGSIRRRALLLSHRPDLAVRAIRGNLDTRIRKLDEGGYDVLVLAAAGLIRLGLESRIGELLYGGTWLPAPAQGALGLVCREGDERTLSLLEPLRHPPSETAVRAERSLLHALHGGCQVPIGALATSFAGGLRLRAVVASPDGQRVVRGDLTGDPRDPEGTGRSLADLLLRRGAADILDEVDAARTPPLTHP